MDHILSQAKAKVNCKRLVIDEKKTRCINEIRKKVDSKQKKSLLNTLANKIRKKGKNKAIKN